MKFTITATQPLPPETAAKQSDPHHSGEWLEAEADADDLEDVFNVLRVWATGDIEPYGHGPVTFTIVATP